MNKEIVKQLFPEMVEAVENKLFPICRNPIDITSFKGLIYLREYKISGMCQACQDSIFDNV